MAPDSAPRARTETAGPGEVRVRYWAAARAAAGVSEDVLPVPGELTLADVRERALACHAGTADRLASVLAVCSALVDDRPVGRAAAAEVVVRPGQTVEFLPPFAGG